MVHTFETLDALSYQPHDRQGIFHGGSSPEDIYLRIAIGLKGTPMPATIESQGVKAVFTPDQIWHLVDYVRALATRTETVGN